MERQQEELVASFADRIRAADAELRRTLGAFAADAEAQRSALAERLSELSRRVDEVSAVQAFLARHAPTRAVFAAASCANKQTQGSSDAARTGAHG